MFHCCCHNVNNIGRFFEQQWNSMEKTSQALQEGQPKLRQMTTNCWVGWGCGCWCYCWWWWWCYVVLVLLLLVLLPYNRGQQQPQQPLQQELPSFCDTIPTKNGWELMEIWVSKLVTKNKPNWQRIVVLCVHNTTSALNSWGMLE